MGEEIIFKGIVIKRSGTWNGIIYIDEEIEKAFKKMPKELPVFENFDQNKLIGIASNFKFENGNIIADAKIKKEIEKEMLKSMGIMPTLICDFVKENPNSSDEENLIAKNFEIKNLSLVGHPCWKNLNK